MNITEANHVCRLVRYLAPAARDEPTTDEQAQESLAWLAERSHKALMAGPQAADVMVCWRGRGAEVELGDPPPELADAWARYQRGDHVEGYELSKLDEWRADRAQDYGL